MIREDEIVTEIDMSQSEEEIKRQERANFEAKMRHAARREQERLDAPSFMDKFINGIAKVKEMFARKKNNKLQQNKSKQR